MAADINQIVIVGRLTRDAELKTTQTGFSVGSMSIAVNRTRKQGDQWVSEANFFDVSLMGRQAEALMPYLKKGKQIAINGELRQNRWQQDGQNRSRVDIVASNVQLLGGNSGGENGGNGYSQGGNYASGGTADFSSVPSSNYSSPYSAPQTPPAQQAPSAIPGFIPDEYDDDIPF